MSPSLLLFPHHLLGGVTLNHLCTRSPPPSVHPQPAGHPHCPLTWDAVPSLTPMPTPHSSGGGEDISFTAPSHAPRVLHTQLHRVVHGVHAPLHTVRQSLPHSDSHGAPVPSRSAHAAFTHAQPPPRCSHTRARWPVSPTWAHQVHRRAPTPQACTPVAHSVTRTHTRTRTPIL